MTTKSATPAETYSETSVIDTPYVDWLRRIALLITIAGILMTSYLVYTHYSEGDVYCSDTGKFDCNAVQSSYYSQVFGIPVSLLGLGGYITFFLLLALENRIDFIAYNGRMILFGLTFFGVAFSAYLSYIEGFVLHKWCMYCIASAVMMTLMFLIATTRVLRTPTYEEI